MVELLRIIMAKENHKTTDSHEDDDCPMCRMMRMEEEGEKITPEMMKEFFKEVKAQGGIVGGPMVDALLGDEEENEAPLGGDEANILHALMEEGGAMKIPDVEGGDVENMPEWMACGWRRVPCGRYDCPICSRMARRDAKHRAAKTDPNSMETVFEDVGADLAEALAMIKKDADRMGIDIENIKDIKESPKEDTFPLWRTVCAWQKKVYALAPHQEGGEVENPPFWLSTEAGADLMWYAGTLSAKTYRQLCNRWHIDEQDNYGEFDYDYTQTVIEEVCVILERSLGVLADMDNRIPALTKEFQAFKKDVLQI